MATTIAQLRTLARQRADMENSNFVGSTELDGYLQDSYAELYDLLVGKHQDYYVAEPEEFSLANGEYTYALPSDFYKLLGVDVSLSGRWRDLDPFNFNERNVTASARRELGRYASVRYRVIGQSLHLAPADGAEGSYRLWYVPTCPALTTVGSMDAVSDKWRDYVVVDTAIKMLAKEESDTTVLERAKMALLQRIEAAAAAVDAGRSARVTDVRSDRYREDY